MTARPGNMPICDVTAFHNEWRGANWLTDGLNLARQHEICTAGTSRGSSIMDSVVFIAALGVGILLAAWYFANEDQGAQGDAGILALTTDTPADDEMEGKARYKMKARTKPKTGAVLNPPPTAKSYRIKEARSGAAPHSAPGERANR